MNGRIALSAFFALAWVVQARSASLGLGAVVLEPGVAVDVVAESISPEEVTRDKREPGAILGLLGGHGHHHGHHGGHHGGGGSGAGSFASASAGSGSFNNNLGGYGGSGSQASANSQSATYSFGPFSASFSSSQANAGSQSQSGGGLFDFF